jgi:hypothetical protein
MVTTAVVLAALSDFTWIIAIFVVLFAVEAWFKVTSLVHCRNLQRCIDLAQRDPNSLLQV